MKELKIEWKKAIAAGIAAGFASMVLVGNLLYLNPIVMGTYDQFKNLPGQKPVEAFGGLVPWLAVMMLGGIALWVIIGIVYSILHKGIPGKGWKKGLYYGLILWLVADFSTAFGTWMMRDYPDILIGIELANALIGDIAGGIVLALVYDKVR